MKDMIHKLRFIKIIIIIIFIMFIFNKDIPISYAQDNNVVGTVVDVATAPINWPAKTAGAILGAVGLSPESLALGGLNSILGFLKDFLLFILGKTITPLLTSVMSYQNFFSDGVNTGWKITRDFANLFFALVLLIIAIATVLNIGALSNYTAKRMLPNFIFVALFINFSKAIVGFLIDISQIIMISFYNSFGPNLSDIIGNASKLAQSGAETAGIDNMSINVFTIIIVSILAFVLLWTALILAMRIVTLWFVIMTSPLAFMATLIPGLGSIYNDWKNKLQEALVTGPTLMFFLYLAFALMNNGISIDNIDTGNLMTNGNLINYVLVIGILFLANTTATKAGQSAPGALQKAVGIAGSIATLGIGARIGAGGTGLRQGLKDGWSATGGKVVSGVDGTLSGTTRAIQAGSFGNVKLNSRYEAMKKDMVARNDAGKGLFRGLGQQFSKEGREEQQKDFELTQARAYAKSKNIDDPDKKRYKKALTASMAEIATEIKDATNAAELGKKYLKALEDGETEVAATIAAKISTLDNGWNVAMTKNNNKIFNEALKKGSKAEQMKYIWEQSFGEIVPNNGLMREAQSRIVTNLKDKGQGGFADGLTNESSSEKAVKGGVAGVARAFSKNKGILERRVTIEDPTTGEEVFENNDDGTPKYETNPYLLYDMIVNEGEKTLRDPKSWNPFDKERKNYDKVLRDILNNPDKYKDKISKPDINKIEAALEGLDQGYSKPKRPAGFRTD
jgi:hypothetical protein